jgi:translation initiation factor IF-1
VDLNNSIQTQNRGDLLILRGAVTESLPNTMFRVRVEEGPAELIGKIILCTLNGNMRRFRIKVLPGDPVQAEMSLYDLGKARITRRLREGDASFAEATGGTAQAAVAAAREAEAPVEEAAPVEAVSEKQEE